MRARRFVTVGIGAVLVSMGVWIDAASGERAGDAVLINGGVGSGQLASGGSSTPFSLRLPAGAACPGDSANGNYRVQSFIVPAGVDPAALTYESQKPAGEGRWALYDVETTPYAQVLTEMATTAGEPGRIMPLPPLSFAVFDPGMFPNGRYRIGVACTEWSETRRHWDTEIDIIADPSDAPAQLRWEVVGSTGSAGAAGTPLLVGVTAIGAVVAVGVVMLRRRVLRSSPTHQPGPLSPASPNQTQEKS